MATAKDNGKVILVTGINGFIASWIGLLLLGKGYWLRGTVRRRSSADELIQGAFKKFQSQVDIHEVQDFTVESCFRDVLRGVHGIIHTASPFDLDLKRYTDFKDPAVRGSLNLLHAATESAGPQLRCVVFTSSVVTLLDPRKSPDYVFSEVDVGDYFEQEVERLGSAAPSRMFYVASKVAAEKAVWQYRRDFQPSYAICTIHPGAVIGPSVQLPRDPSFLSETVKPIWKVLSGEAREVPPGFGNGAYCDVRDVAKLHVWCMEHPKDSSGQRLIANAGQGLPQAMVDILQAAYPKRQQLMVSGMPLEGYNPDFSYVRGGIDGSLAVALTGQAYIKFDKAVRDTAQQMEAWLDF